MLLGSHVMAGISTALVLFHCMDRMHSLSIDQMMDNEADLGTIMNNAARNSCVQILRSYVFTALGYIHT